MMKFLKNFWVVLMLSFVLMSGSSGSVFAADSDSPKADSDQFDVGIQGFFDPSFKYLDQGECSIVENGTGTAKIKVFTMAKQSVDSIGTTIYFDWWSGTSWIQLNSTQISDSNTSMLDGSATFTVASGYYYRARTVHWVSHQGVYEQGTRVTATILAQ